MLPKAEVGKKLMLIYVDIYGNEHREVKTSADFGNQTARTGTIKTARPGPRAKAGKVAARRLR